MSKKIFGEVEQKAIELAKIGYNANRIAITIGVSEGAVSGWAKRNNVVLIKRSSPEAIAKIPKFIELLESGRVLKHICLELNLDHRAALKIIKENNLSHLLRDRASAAKDKCLSMEEATSRLPENHGIAIQFLSAGSGPGEYVIQRSDGTTYRRIASQLFHGDPNFSKKPRITEEEAASRLLVLGYRLIPGTFRIKREPVQAEHIVCGYVRENILTMFSKQSCPKCTHTGTSQEEIVVDDWVKSLGVDSKKFRFEKDCIGPGRGREIDIYVQELNLGIEYCGLYSHGEKGTQRTLDEKIEKSKVPGSNCLITDLDSPKWRHKAKQDKANKLGIQLITLFCFEWKNSEEKIKAILKAKLGKNEIKIFARKTELREIDKKASKDFLNTYHLQGNAPTIVSFGLFYGEELVAVITGGHHHRKKGKFVLNRLCFKANTTVVGGASKLNKALENWAKANGYDEIVSWSDNRWSEGGVYKALGYTLSGELPPDYVYWENGGKVYSKQSCQKKHLLAKGATGNTESEMAKSLGYDRIWDCGKKTWVKKLA